MVDFQTLGLVFILIHEMDAIRCKEWRILPGLSLLNDTKGSILFLLLHIPLLYWVLTEFKTGQVDFRTGFNYFLIIHFALHIVFFWHKKNEFKDWISWTIITGAAIFGLLDLISF